MTPEQRKILTKHSPEGWTPGTETALPELLAAERERCAKMLESWPGKVGAKWCAEEIRKMKSN